MLTTTSGQAARGIGRRALLAVPALLALAGTGLLLLPGSAPAFTLQEIEEWVVSCDNTATCSLVNASQQTQLRVARPSPFGISRVCIHRKAGADAAPQVFLTLRQPRPYHGSSRPEDRLLRVAGAQSRLADIAMAYRGSEHWEIPTATVGTLLGGLGASVQLHIVTRDGTVLERLSVDGIDRALSVIDKAQQRDGTTTALREKGTRPAASVPPENRPQALVTAPLPLLASGQVPSPAALKLRHDACGAPGLDATKGYRLLGDQLRTDRTLWVTPCDSREGLRRAYFAIENADGTAAPAVFPGTSPERPTGHPGVLARPEFDPATGRVRELWRESVQPAHGNHCAIQRLWGWNGKTFELAEERRSLSCAGVVTGYWPRTYRRDITTPAADGAVATAASFQPPC